MACPATIRMGYLGMATIAGNKYFLTGSSINAVQSVNAPDHVQGYHVRRGWNYGKVEFGGNISGPCHEDPGGGGGGIAGLLDAAKDRTVGDRDHMSNVFEIDLMFYEKGGGYKVADCQVNSLGITATAGDVANFTLDIMTCQKPEDSSTDVGDGLECSKLITWDQVKVDGISAANYYQAVNFTLNNSLERQYAISENNTEGLFPVDITAGLQSVTGSISAYLTDGMNVNIGSTFALGDFGADAFADYTPDGQQDITITVGTQGALSFKAQFHRPEASSQTSAQIVTLNFTGVCEIE